MRRVLLSVLVTGVCATGAGMGEPRVTVYPANAKPGDKVSVYVHECTTTTTDSIVASSMAFEGRHVRLARNGTPGGWAGSVEVHDKAVSSAHEVTVRCSDRLVKAYITVGGGHPRGGPDTGGGGLAMAATAARSEERVSADSVPGESARTPWLAGALAVLALTAGGGALAAARRRRRGSRDAAP